MSEFTQTRFQQVNTGGCADTTCGRSVIINEDPCPDCCGGGGGGGEGPPGPAGPAGPKGPTGPAGRPPLIRCGCLETNEEDGGSGGSIQQQCIDDITGKVVMSSTGIDYYSQNTTSNNFFQDNCFSGVGQVCGYFNVTNSNTESPPLGKSTGSLGTISTTLTGDKYIVAWGYIGTGGVPNVNYTWKYGDFKKLNGLGSNKLTATQGSKFTFMPTDSLFTGNGQIDLGGWKSIVTENPPPSQDLIAAFLNDFPQCATDGTGTPPSPKNGQGGNIMDSAGKECSCEGCTEDNALKPEDDIAAGDVFIDACNKIMYIAGDSGAFPANGIPFGPEDRPCPPPPDDCPDCPDCPPPTPCGTCKEPIDGFALQNADWCKCTGELGSLYNLIANSNCLCPVGGELPKCPQECKKTDGKSFDPPQYYYKDAKKECPCNDDGDSPKCPQQCPSDPKSDYYQDATKECPCEEGKTDAGCQTNCASSAARICPEDCPKCDTCCPECPACDSCCSGGTHGQQAQAPCTKLVIVGGTFSVDVSTSFNCIDGGTGDLDLSLGCVDDDGVYCQGAFGGNAVVIDLPPFIVQMVTCSEANNAGYNSDTACKDGSCGYYKNADYYENLYLPKIIPERVSLNCDGSPFSSGPGQQGAFLGGGL
jgi:hypothetical protein